MSRLRRRAGLTVRPALALSLLLLAPACARNPRPATAPTIPTAGPVEALRAELDDIFLTPAFEHALWGVKVQSMETGQVLYELNPSKLMMPASNMKLVTMAVAATRLGWDHRFETVLATNGSVESGVMHGDLIVRGGGDPTIGADGDSPTEALDDWAQRLTDEGIREIDGRIIGDDDAFDDEAFGDAWEWTDIPFGSAAPISALQFNQGVVRLTITPGDTVGDPVTIAVEPDGSLLTIVNHATTTAAGERGSIGLARWPTQPELVVSGSLPLGAAPARRTAAVVNPTVFFVHAFRNALVRHGIDVRGDAVDIDDLKETDDQWRLDPSARHELVSFASDPLADVGTELMKVSQNLYAETFLKTLGLEFRASGTAAAGREVVAEVLTSWGVPQTGYLMFDGSGLSRRNYLTAETLVKILRAMYRGESYDQFLATLPIAGVDGTLARRMRATRAEGNVRAKTGTISNTRTLSGYVTTRDDEVLAFSILANHFYLPGQTVLDQIDLAAERLANFSREP